MNLVIDNTVEVNGNEKNDIGMVVGPDSFHLFSLSFNYGNIFFKIDV